MMQSSTTLSNLRVPFGQKNGQMVTPAEVESGRACECTCPSCAIALVAKKGEQNVWHFAHDGAACATGAETAIHLMAKQILAQEQNIRLPAVEVALSATDAFGSVRTVSEKLAKPRHIHYDQVELEVARDNRRPDAIGLCDEPQVEHRIEVFVRHPVDPVKARELEALGCLCYEICLNDISALTSVEQLRLAVIASPERIRWIAYPGMAALRQKLADNLRKMLHTAEMKKKAEDAAFERAYAAQSREEKAPKTVWARRTRERTRREDQIAQANAAFRSAGEAEKRAYLKAKLRMSSDEPPTLVNQAVQGDDCLGVPRDIWQTDVFRKAVFAGGPREIALESVIAWLRLRYEIAPAFPNAIQVAVWEYFTFLEKRGFVRHLGRQRFKVCRDVAPWLESTVVVTGSWFWAPEAFTCSLRDLQDVNDEGKFEFRSDTLLTILQRVRAEYRANGQPDDAARSLAQLLQMSPNTILLLLSAARIVSLPQSV